MNKIIPVMVALSFACAHSAFAISLDEARSKGLVGEKRSGYVVPVTQNPDGEVNKLVSEINTRRKGAYEQIAKKNGSPITVVEQIGAKEAFEKAPSGTFIEGPDGKWVRK